MNRPIISYIFGSFLLFLSAVVAWRQPMAMKSDSFWGNFGLKTLSSSSIASSASKTKLGTVIITGATGLVGKALTEKLEGQGVRVVKVSTKPPKDENSVQWNIAAKAFSDASLLEGADAVIHLAGENVASGEGLLAALGAWTENKKKNILDSRIEGTKLLVDTLAQLKKKPKVLISASGVGFYGFKDADTSFDESTTSKGEGFLASVCEAWETEALRAQSQLRIRTVCLRLAPVFSTKGGIIKKLLPIFGLGAGGILGNGKQGFSWVSLNDVVRAIEFAASGGSLSGPVNLCSPQPVTNAEFTSAMGKALSRPVIFPVPGPVISTVLGDMGNEMLLGGQKVLPKKLLKAGFKFEDSDITESLKTIISKKL